MSTPCAVILPEDVTVERVSLPVWRGPNGQHYHSEAYARSQCSTHMRCAKCQTVVERSYGDTCFPCQRIREIERYAALPRQPWDGVAMVYSEQKDRYYNTPDEAFDYMEEGEKLSDLRLLICSPQHARQFCADDFRDLMPEEETELPDVVTNALEAYNKAVADVVLSWAYERIALQLTEDGTDYVMLTERRKGEGKP